MNRLPALLTHDDMLREIECAELEISMCKQLHDTKNAFSIILDEMQGYMWLESNRLRMSISDLYNKVTGNQT